MRGIRALAALAALALVLTGCIDEEVVIPSIVARAFSDPAADGDIGFFPEPQPDGIYIISQAVDTGNVLFGLDTDLTEYRAFLDFPLDGSTGDDVVPLEAVILAADIEVHVNAVDLASVVPTLLDLVPFPLDGLTEVDFDSDPLATLGPFDFLRSDAGFFVRIDVTDLMAEAQRLGLPDLQLRFLLDFVPGAAGLVEIDDGVEPGDEERAPLLTVEYR